MMDVGGLFFDFEPESFGETAASSRSYWSGPANGAEERSPSVRGRLEPPRGAV